MARVFLSYDREDAGKAKALAAALERAGHSVWWDRHITGGAQYSKAIEEALEAAQAVVVLWSKRSIESAWVRDEAASGRDRGRLVPVSLDGSQPPIGFRQFQTIELTTGRMAAAQRAALLGAIDAVAKPGDRAAAGDRPQPTSRRWDLRPLVIGAGIAALLGAVFLWKPWALGTAPTVTVVPASNSAASRELASDLLIKLGSLQSSRPDALQLVEANAPDPRFSFKVTAVPGAQGPNATVALIRGDRRTLLWSREFAQPGGNNADLRQQLAYAMGRVLHCANQATEAKLRPDLLKLFLNGCAELSVPHAQSSRAVIPALKRVTEEEARFIPGWSLLLQAETHAFSQTGLTDRALRRDLRAHIDAARKVMPTLAEAYLAEGWLQNPRPILGWFRFSDLAVDENPDHPEALATRALALRHVGRMREAVADAKRAAEVDPLSSSARLSLIQSQMDSGAAAAAASELREAERLWPGASNLGEARFVFDFYYGDPRRALQALRSGDLLFSVASVQEPYLEARIDPSAQRVERAVAAARSAARGQPGSGLSLATQVLARLNHSDEVIETLLALDPSVHPGIVTIFFRPSFRSVRASPRFMQIAERFGLSDYWRSSGKWPDFCFEPDLPYDCKAEAAKLAA